MREPPVADRPVLHPAPRGGVDPQADGRKTQPFAQVGNLVRWNQLGEMLEAPDEIHLRPPMPVERPARCHADVLHELGEADRPRGIRLHPQHPLRPRDMTAHERLERSIPQDRSDELVEIATDKPVERMPDKTHDREMLRLRELGCRMAEKALHGAMKPRRGHLRCHAVGFMFQQQAFRAGATVLRDPKQGGARHRETGQKAQRIDRCPELPQVAKLETAVAVPTPGSDRMARDELRDGLPGLCGPGRQPEVQSREKRGARLLERPCSKRPGETVGHPGEGAPVQMIHPPLGTGPGWHRCGRGCLD